MPPTSTRSQMPGRLLRLLSLLETRRQWPGRELSERLGITDRTLRRDIDRLRALDYPVHGTTGTTGGYRLASGKNLPPLLLDDAEVLAVATGLATAASGSVAGIRDSALRALAKLEQVLPARLRPRLAALGGATAAVPAHRDAPPVDPAALATLAACCRGEEILSFAYRDRAGHAGIRRVEPHSLVTVRGFWYLLAYDPDRDDWRTFRVDRIDRPTATHHRFTPRPLPAPDAASYLADSFAAAPYRYTASISVRLSADQVRAGLFAGVPGSIQPAGSGRCTVRLSADSAELVTQYVAAVAALGAEFQLEAPDEITRRVRELGRRLAG